MRFITLLLWGLVSITASAGTVVVSDPFTDGNRSNTSGGDTQGLVFYLGQTTSTLVVSNDDAGIGSGNALLFTPAAGAGFGKYLAYIPPLMLLAAGDSLVVSFDYRFLATPTNISAGLRMGLYNTMGTRQGGDGSDTGFRSDDVGYGFQTNPGTNYSLGTTIYSEASGNDILGGASPGQTANIGTAGASVNSGTTKHSAVFEVSRQPNGDFAFSAKLDGGTPATATIAAASLLTNSFDEFGISEGGTGFAVPYFIDNLVISTTAADDFDRLRYNWWVLQTGGTNYNLNDTLVKSRLSSITNTANGYWNTLNKSVGRTYLWNDLTNTTDSGQISTAYARLRAMALAYCTYGSLLRSNATMAVDIQGALDWMYTNRYNEAAAEYDNWYDWEIGAPLSIVDIGVFMYDALGISGLSNTLNALDHFVPAPFSGTSGTSTGGNLTDKIRSVAVRGAVVKDASKLAAARDAFSSLFNYVTSGDGYYADGSFIQHTRHPYNGSYGLVAIQDTSMVLPWLIGSPWESTDPDRTNVIQWVYNSYEPLIYSGAMMDMTRGRAVSRYSNQDHTAGASTIQWILTLAVSPFPAPADALRMKSMVKYWALVDTYRNLTSNMPLQLIAASEQLMADNSVPSRGELLGHWTYAGMDRVVHLRPGWGFGLSMSSSRVYNYESINSEDLHGWFEGDGMTCFYNSDQAQFSDEWHPTINPYRLPGTTVDTTARADASGQSYLGSKNWVGGATLFTNGVAGMELDAYNSSLTARKSWFMFDDEVVCLGTGITSGTTSTIESIVENRKISSSNTNAFVVGGITMPTTLGVQTNLTNITWCSLGGAGGYYFPGGATLRALRENRTGAWSQINSGGTTTITNKNFLTLWADHGVKPTNASYAYVLLPNYSALQASNYALSPEITILDNSTNAQAVKETTLNIVAANVWNDGTRAEDLITVNKKCAVLTQETAAALAFSISDPTQTNTGVINVTLNRAANSILALDPAITVTQLRPTIQMTVSMNNSFGQSRLAIFKLQNSAPTLTPIANRTISAGVALTVTNAATDPDLPYQTLSFSMGGGATNVAIDSASGLLTWRPTVAQAGTTNSLPVVVTDNGTPPLSATQSFSVVVARMNLPALGQTSMSGGKLRFSITGDFGPDYAIQASSNLMSWTTIFSTSQPALPFTWTEPAPSSSGQQFYRVQLAP